MIIFLTALPLAPPVTPPTIAWDVAVVLAAGAVLAYGYFTKVKTASSSISTQTASSTTSCSTGDPPDPKCKESADTIDRILNGRKNPGGKDYKSIGQRAEELKANPQNQPMFWDEAHPGVPRPLGSDRWGHLLQIEQQQTELTNALQDYFANNCKNVSADTLSEAADWAMKDPLDLL